MQIFKEDKKSKLSCGINDDGVLFFGDNESGSNLPDTPENRELVVRLFDEEMRRRSVTPKSFDTKLIISDDLSKMISDLENKTAQYAYDNYGLHRDEGIVETAVFSNGYEMDIKLVVPSEPGQDCWTEAVLFKNGKEIAHSDVDNCFFGDWNLEDREGNKYMVSVISEMVANKEVCELDSNLRSRPIDESDVQKSTNFFNRTEELLNEIIPYEGMDIDNALRSFVDKHGYCIVKESEAFGEGNDYRIPNAYFIYEGDAYSDSAVIANPINVFQNDGGRFINDIFGIERNCYIDTPENREVIINSLLEHPEMHIENWRDQTIYDDDKKWQEYRDSFEDDLTFYFKEKRGCSILMKEDVTSAIDQSCDVKQYLVLAVWGKNDSMPAGEYVTWVATNNTDDKHFTLREGSYFPTFNCTAKEALDGAKTDFKERLVKERERMVKDQKAHDYKVSMKRGFAQ